jgi:hypothetical protein
MRHGVSLTLAVALVSGCYSYQLAGPVDSVAPLAGKRVTLRLTDQGTAQLVGQLGGGISSVEGEIVGADADQLEVAVASTEDTRRTTADWRGERVVIPRHAVASVRERRFSPGATGLAGALVVGGLAGAYALFSGDDSVLEGRGPTQGPGPGGQ